MPSMVSDPFRLSFLERAEKVYAAQFLFVGNPYESTIFAYIPLYIANKLLGHALLLFPAKRFEFTGGLGVFVLSCWKWAESKCTTFHGLFLWTRFHPKSIILL